MKTPPVGAELFHADRRTNVQTHDEANIPFFAVLTTRLKTFSCLCCSQSSVSKLYVVNLTVRMSSTYT